MQRALNMGNWGSIILTAVASYFLVTWLMSDKEMYLLRDLDVQGNLKEGVKTFTRNGILSSLSLFLLQVSGVPTNAQDYMVWRSLPQV